MDQYLRSCGRDLSNVEVCELFNSIAEAFRRQSKFALDYALAVARYVAKRFLRTKYKVEVGRMHRFFDKAIVELFTGLKKSEITPATSHRKPSCLGRSRGTTS